MKEHILSYFYSKTQMKDKLYDKCYSLVEEKKIIKKMRPLNAIILIVYPFEDGNTYCLYGIDALKDKTRV